MADALVSVIVPVYNVEKYLGRCYGSLKRQTHDNLEIIFVDDGSTDGCGGLCDGYARQDHRVRVIHQRNMGAGLARNSGLDAARGEYVAFADPDDYVEPDYIRAMYEAVRRHQADTAISGMIRHNKGYSNILRPRKEEEVHEGREAVWDVMADIIEDAPGKRETKLSGSNCAKLYSMALVRAHHIRNCFGRDFFSEDILFQPDYFRYAQKVVLIPDALYHYIRTRQDSQTNIYREDRFAMNKKFVMELRKKCAGFMPEEIYDARIKKLFLGRTRACLEKDLMDGGGRQFHRIVRDPFLQEILESYPCRADSIPVCLFNICVKHKLDFALKLLIRLRIWKKVLLHS